MKFALVLLSTFLMTACRLIEGLTVIVESPDAYLLKDIRLSKNWLVYHTESNTYVDFTVRGDERGVRYTRYPREKVEIKIYPDYPIPTYSHLANGWTLAILPARGAMDQGLTIEAWLEATGFQDHRSDLLCAWLKEREAGEPFTVAVIFSLPRELDSLRFDSNNLDRLLVYHISEWKTLSVHEGRELWSLSEEDGKKRKLVSFSSPHHKGQSLKFRFERPI